MGRAELPAFVRGTRIAEREGMWRRLAHRWFVQYNPLYLLSAGLVLGGMFLLSRGLAQSDRVGALGVAAISEIYALALIGGAAVLVRIGQRRPAVLLALLAVVYQGDLTLLTETAPHLGGWGIAADVAWLALFAGKLALLARAMRARLSWAAHATAVLGGLGLVVGPHALPWLGAAPRLTVLGVWTAAMIALQEHAHLTTAEPLDAWGETVLRRFGRATWTLWLAFVLVHITFWAGSIAALSAMVLLGVPMFALRFAHQEHKVWIIAAFTLALTALISREALSLMSGVVAIFLVAHAYRRVAVHREDDDASAPTPPYRSPPGVAIANAVGVEMRWLDVPIRARYLAGAAAAAHLSVWSVRPAHVFALDLALTAIVVALAWWASRPLFVAPAIVVWTHFAAPFVPMPETPLGWGALSVVTGFVLLASALGVSWRLRPRDAEATSAAP